MGRAQVCASTYSDMLLCKTGLSVRGFRRITRRDLLAGLSALGSYAQTGAVFAQSPAAPRPSAVQPPGAAQQEDQPLRQLRPSHPRLLLLDADMDRLRGLVHENQAAKRIYAEFEKECDRLLSTPPVEYKIPGGRFSAQTRRALDRIVILALMYRISGRDPWFRRAVMEMNAAANFRDWNPGHFLDVAEMTGAFAIGYDWLYNALAPEDRGPLRDALLAKGLAPSMAAYQSQSLWTHDRGYWNVVCNSSVMLGALAIADEAEEEAAPLIRRALESVPHGIANYTADGGWPEGPYYWEQATRAACVLFSALETSLGTDYGLSSPHALERTGRFRIYLNGPTNRVFNFGESGDDLGSVPEMFWMARRYANPVYAWSELKEVDHNPHDDPWDLAWFSRESRSPQSASWPLDAVFHGVHIASFRASWDDPNAVFLAVRGGDNKTPHTHLDLGNFVLDAGGIRWALDLGPEEALPAAGPGSRPRPLLTRGRTDLHNTVTIDGENQDPRAEAHIVRQDLSPDVSWVQIDLSKAYPKLRTWTRKIGLARRQAALIEDNIRSDQPVEAIWGLMTDADISTAGQSATLHKAGWNLAAEIISPRHALFDEAATRPGLSQSVRRLVVRLSDKVTELDLVISLAPYRDGQPRPKVNSQFPS
jgi:Heparinase II/III-like protein